MDKTILLASFVYTDKISSFIEYLNEHFSIEKTKVFGYELFSDNSKVLITFKLTLKDGKQINLREHFQNSVIIHKRGEALYTINALNELIKSKIGDDVNNLDIKSVKLDWSKYQEKLILIDNGKLALFTIKRIF